MEFRPYMHVGRLIEDPETYGMLEENDYFVIQPKIDGCNAVIWWDEEQNRVRCGNRNRELSKEDNGYGFYAYVETHKELEELSRNIFPGCYLYGEWLVENHIDYYRPEAWNKFYIFDIWDTNKNCYLAHYVETINVVEDFSGEIYKIDRNWIHFQPGTSAKEKMQEFEKMLKTMNKEGYLMNPGETRSGEGMVIKCYDWRNSLGEQKWAKLRTDEYMKKVYTPRYLKDRESIEEEIVRKFLMQWDIDKVVAKLKQNKCFDQWDKKYIGDLLTAMWYDFINEYMPVIADIYKHDRICFHDLRKALNARIKYLRCDLF